jgi:hypothetical protein
MCTYHDQEFSLVGVPKITKCFVFGLGGKGFDEVFSIF